MSRHVTSIVTATALLFCGAQGLAGESDSLEACLKAANAVKPGAFVKVEKLAVVQAGSRPMRSRSATGTARNGS